LIITSSQFYDRTRRQIRSFLHRLNLRRFRWQKVDGIVIHVPKTAGSFVKQRILSVISKPYTWGIDLYEIQGD